MRWSSNRSTAADAGTRASAHTLFGMTLLCYYTCTLAICKFIAALTSVIRRVSLDMYEFKGL